jgi:hypothetical protein
MSRPVAVVLNDTSTRYHHGCARVMRLLVAGLEGAGLTVGLRVPARAKWEHDLAVLAAMRAAQVIVINGEGTFHDGAEGADRLLSAVDAAPGVPVALVNALWERNPAAWADRVGRLALIAARDSRSAGELGEVTGQVVRWLPDLSLSAPAGVAAGVRSGLIVGDSVRLDKRRALARAAQRLGALSLPTKTLQGRVWGFSPARALLWRGYNGVWTGALPRFEMAGDEATYLRRIAAAEGHVTGRFHAVCLSMLTETPFLALGSTTSKVQTLLTDAGLGQDRLISEDDLAGLTVADAVRPFSAAELDSIRAFKEGASEKAGRLFADIRGLVA